MHASSSQSERLRLAFAGLTEESLLPECSYTNATGVLISIGHYHWRRVQREDFLWHHQPDSGFMLVKQLKATIEKVAVLFHILLNPLAVLKRFIMNIARHYFYNRPAIGMNKMSNVDANYYE
jgi:hypothetical protein